MTSVTEQRDVTPQGAALKAMGYRVLEDDATAFAMTLETPFEGADIHAILAPCERNHYGLVAVKNTRGIGWCMKVEFVDMGRSVAKKLLRSLAIETRRAYNHRGLKIRRRAIARAIAKKEGAGND